MNFKLLFNIKIFIFIWLFPSQVLFAWSGDKLSDGSCQFDMDTGYSYTSVYVNNQLDSYVIIGVNDPRYGVNEYVYNGNNCEFITSGSAKKSSYRNILRNNNFEKIISSRRGKVEKMDKWLKAITTFSTDAEKDAIYVHIQANSVNVLNEVNSIIKSITSNNNLKLPNESNYLIGKFKHKFIEVIKNTKLNSINYDNFFMLIQHFSNLTDLKYSLSKKIDRYIAYNLNVVSDIPPFEQNILREYSQYSKSYLSNYPKIKDFGKSLSFNNLRNSIEYQYFFKKVKFDIKIDKKEPFVYVTSQNPKTKLKLIASNSTNDISCSKTNTETYTRQLGIGEQLFTLGMSNSATVTQYEFTCKFKNGYKDRMRSVLIQLNSNNLSSVLNTFDKMKHWRSYSKSENWHVLDAMKESIRHSANAPSLHINVQDGRWLSNTVKTFTIEIEGDSSTNYLKQKDSSGSRLFQSGYADFRGLMVGNYKIKVYGIDTQGRETFSRSGSVYIDDSGSKYCTIYTKSNRIECR